MNLSPDERELVKLRSELQALLESPAWLALEGRAEKMVAIWTREVIQPSNGEAMDRYQQYAKGVRFGIGLLAGTPRRIIAESQSILAEKEAQDAPRREFESPVKRAAGGYVYGSPEHIAAELGLERVGPNARITADSNDYDQPASPSQPEPPLGVRESGG